MLFGHKKQPPNKLQIDLGDLQNEKEQLSRFLQSKLKVSITPIEEMLTVDSEALSAQELQHAMTKFIYHRNLNATHWVSVEGKTVKINRFNVSAKKTEKHEKKTYHQTAAQSWGL